jgi:phosphoglycolate phosphatase
MIATTDYELLIFDWDGTLMDSSEKIVNCFAGAAVDCAMPIADPEQVKRYIGLSLAESFTRLYSPIDGAMVACLVDRYREHWLVLDQTSMRLFEGVEKGLANLDAAGYLLAIATGKSWRGLERSLKESGLDPLFTYARCADQSRPKPDPAMLFDILDYTGLACSDGVMIGDTTYDLEMAQSAGMNGWGVGYGSHAARHLQPLSIHAVAPGFVDLVDQLI